MSRSGLPSIAESIAAPAIQILPNPAPPSPQSPRTLALCFADHQICGSLPGLIIKGLRSTYVVRNMHPQIAGIAAQVIADGRTVVCKQKYDSTTLRATAYRLFVYQCTP